MENMLEIIEDNERLVAVRHLCKTPLGVALNPEFSLNDAYYTITKGKNHTFTTVSQDGKTWSFDFGESGSSLVDGITGLLKKRVLAFLLEKDILINFSSRPTRVIVFPSEGSARVTFKGSKGESQSFLCESMEAAKAKAEALMGVPLHWERWYNDPYWGEGADIN